jgi:hypothetical protein
VRDLPPHPDGNLRFAHDLQVDDREIAAHWAAAAKADTRNGLSLRRRGITSLANKLMLATVSAWSRKPPCPSSEAFDDRPVFVSVRYQPEFLAITPDRLAAGSGASTTRGTGPSR